MLEEKILIEADHVIQEGGKMKRPFSKEEWEEWKEWKEQIIVQESGQ